MVLKTSGADTLWRQLKYEFDGWLVSGVNSLAVFCHWARAHLTVMCAHKFPFYLIELSSRTWGMLQLCGVFFFRFLLSRVATHSALRCFPLVHSFIFLTMTVLHTKKAVGTTGAEFASY